MNKRYLFPLFNLMVGAIFGGLAGYYFIHLVGGIASGAAIGLVMGIILEFLFGLGGNTWLYRRRVILTVILEIPLALFLAAPYAYAVLQTMPDQHAICCQSPLDFGAADYESVKIAADDGIQLAGWYIPPRNMPGPAVILLHGARADRMGTTWYAQQFIAAGFGVLMYDQRGLGESEGKLVTMGWQDNDLLNVLDYLEGRPEISAGHVGVVGLSGGGHIALNEAYRAPDRFPALWLDGVQAQTMQDFPAPESNGERFASLINGMMLKMLEFRLGAQPPASFSAMLPALEQPFIVMISAGQDDFERRINDRYRQVAGPNIYLWTIDEAWHGGGPAVEQDEYRQRMLDFFSAALSE